MSASSMCCMNNTHNRVLRRRAECDAVLILARSGLADWFQYALRSREMPGVEKLEKNKWLAVLLERHLFRFVNHNCLRSIQIFFSVKQRSLSDDDAHCTLFEAVQWFSYCPIKGFSRRKFVRLILAVRHRDAMRWYVQPIFRDYCSGRQLYIGDLRGCEIFVLREEWLWHQFRKHLVKESSTIWNDRKCDEEKWLKDLWKASRGTNAPIQKDMNASADNNFRWYYDNTPIDGLCVGICSRQGGEAQSMKRWEFA